MNILPFRKLIFILLVFQSNTNVYSQGRIPTPQEIYEQIPIAESEGIKGPQRFAELYLPPPGEDTVGSCVAFTLGYAIMSFLVMRQNNINDNEYYYLSKNSIDYKKICSPSFLHNYSKGSYFYSELEFLKIKGIPTLSDYPNDLILKNPYKIESDTIKDINALLNSFDNIFRLNEYRRLNLPLDITELQKFLDEGKPIALGMNIDSNFIKWGFSFYKQLFEDTTRKCIWNGNLSGNILGHAVTIVGYNDSIECFKIMNSYGPHWGNHGFFWVPYSILDDKFDTYYKGNLLYSTYLFDEGYILYLKIE